MKKKKLFIILSVAVVFVLVLAFGAIGTNAWFNDQETSEGNLFEAGTLELDVQGRNEANESYTFSNIKPGDSAGWEGVTSPWIPGLNWTVKNTGSIDGVLTVSLKDIVNVGSAPLATQLRPQVRVNGVWKTESSGFHNLNPFTVDLPAGQSVTIAIAWSFYENAGNEYQGASTTFDVHFDLAQK